MRRWALSRQPCIAHTTGYLRYRQAAWRGCAGCMATPSKSQIEAEN